MNCYVVLYSVSPRILLHVVLFVFFFVFFLCFFFFFNDTATTEIYTLSLHDALPIFTEIVRVAERSIDNFIEFDTDATRRITSLAHGHPYMVHLIGKYALRDAFQQKKYLITSESIDETLKNIAESGADPVLEARYKKAVASSPQREIVLKSLAAKVSDDGEVWTTDAYKVALELEEEPGFRKYSLNKETIKPLVKLLEKHAKSFCGGECKYK